MTIVQTIRINLLLLPCVMMAMRLCGKHRIASKYCGFIRYQHTKTRKELIPLIKLLHPDLLGHCSDEVRKQNMSCVQSLNDMWDTLEANIESLVGKSLTNGLDIKVPFRPLYDLTCFLKDASPAATDTRENETEASTNHTEADSIQMVKMPFVIRIPEDLCRKQSVSYKVFSSGIDRVLIQQGLLFMHAGLDNPWKSAAAMGQDGSRSKAHRNEEEGQNALSGELELQLFERWMSRSSLQRDAEGGSVDRRGRSRLSQAFNTQHNTRGATPKVDSSFGNRQVTLSYYEDEVDAFIQVSSSAMLLKFQADALPCL